MPVIKNSLELYILNICICLANTVYRKTNLKVCKLKMLSKFIKFKIPSINLYTVIGNN